MIFEKEQLFDGWESDDRPISDPSQSSSGLWHYVSIASSGHATRRLESKNGVRLVQYLDVEPEKRQLLFESHEGVYGADGPPASFLHSVTVGRYRWDVHHEWTSHRKPDRPTSLDLLDMSTEERIVGSWRFGEVSELAAVEKFYWNDGRLLHIFEYDHEGRFVTGIDLSDERAGSIHLGDLLPDLVNLGRGYWQEGLSLPSDLRPNVFPGNDLERQRTHLRRSAE